MLIITVTIVAFLPYSSSLSIPNGDPAPGRSPGPPTEQQIFESFDLDQESLETDLKTHIDDIILEEERDDDQNVGKIVRKYDDVVSTTDLVYDDATIVDEIEVTTAIEDVSSASSYQEKEDFVGSERTVLSNACAFARTPSDSADVVTLSDSESDINFTVTHSVFDTEELVRGVVYEGKNNIRVKLLKKI